MEFQITDAMENSMNELIRTVKERFSDNQKLGEMFERCYSNAVRTTVKQMEDDTVHIITGDIPAMWLRDSSAQVKPYLVLAGKNEGFRDMIAALLKRQFMMIAIDPYANAFNEKPDGSCWSKDETKRNAWVWERKYEIDSLCYPLQLAWMLWKTTGCTTPFGDNFRIAAEKILEVFQIEQNHEKDSGYRFIRRNTYYTDTLSREGRGSLVKDGIGMTWSGFRPSDDTCTYGYLVPSNMFASVVLSYLSEIAEVVLKEKELGQRAEKLSREIREGIENYAITEKEGFGKVYAYEIDGYGMYNLMDDANVPSLLSMDYIGYCPKDKAVAENTRKMILSEANPYYYSGKTASGIGSPHTPPGYIWHIALAVQGLTEKSREKKREILELLARTEDGTKMMHEGFNKDDPSQYTREWFSWANAMFCELALDYCGIRPDLQEENAKSADGKN